ncbi:MAG: hypothetical protein KJ749_14285, partial [Planctomycetes bacterium]|nr:hypothetical protein [Planctomycetota bacterium]
PIPYRSQMVLDWIALNGSPLLDFDQPVHDDAIGWTFQFTIPPGYYVSAATLELRLVGTGFDPETDQIYFDGCPFPPESAYCCAGIELQDYGYNGDDTVLTIDLNNVLVRLEFGSGATASMNLLPELADGEFDVGHSDDSMVDYSRLVITLAPELYVDDDAPNDPCPGSLGCSDPLEDGSPEHPFDDIQEAINAASHGDRIVVLAGVYEKDAEIDVNKDVSIEGDPCLAAIVQRSDGTGRVFHVEANCSFFGLVIRNAQHGIVERHTGPYGYNWSVRNCVGEDLSIVGFYIDHYTSSYGYAHYTNVVCRNCGQGFSTNNAQGYLAENCAAVSCGIGFNRSFSGGEVRYCGLWNNDVDCSPPELCGPDCVRADPGFGDGYRLRPNSPYIDAGNPEQRDPGSRIDIGAYGGCTCFLPPLACCEDADCNDANICTIDVCDPDGSCGHSPSPGGVLCRDSVGICDVPEYCDGVSLDCPADELEPAGTACRGAVADCDAVEECDGLLVDCPPDEVQLPGVVCRGVAGICDVAEECDGISVDCPTDVFLPGTTECRAVAGDCDVAEYCTGSSADCPGDLVEPPGTLCRGVAGICDVVEQCDGTSVDCPTDVFLPGTTECRAVAGDCDVAEYCTGSSADCPGDEVKPPTTECRAAAGECNVAEYCTGDDVDCPGDDFKPAGVECADDGDECTRDECDGFGNCVHPHNLLCGACCLPHWMCRDDVLEPTCEGLGGTFQGEDIPCGADSDGDTVVNLCDTCPGADDLVYGPCDEDTIPTVSQWGLIILALLLMVGGKVYYGYRRPVPAH